MSRIGREPVVIPQGVDIQVNKNVVTVKGPKGTLTQTFNQHLTYEIKDGKLLVKRPDDSIKMRMQHGTARAIIADMVKGVSEGYSKTLIIKGVGYRAEMKGQDLVLHIGHSHPDVVKAVDGVKIEFDSKKLAIKVSGIDKQLVGQVAAQIRELKKPEPYHGKGIRYEDEVVTLRAPASAKKTAGAA